MAKIPISNIREAISGNEIDFLCWLINGRTEPDAYFVVKESWFARDFVRDLSNSDPRSFVRLVLLYLHERFADHEIELPEVDENGESESAGEQDGSD